MPTPKQDYARRLNEVATRYGRMENATVRMILDLLRTTRNDIVAQFADASGGSAARMDQQRRNINRLIDDMEVRAASELRANIPQAVKTGAEMVTEPLQALGFNVPASPSIGVGAALLTPTSAQLNTLLDFSADLIKGIGEQTRSAVNLQLRQVALGQINPNQAMRNVTDIFGKVGTAQGRQVVSGISAKAETDVRTEMQRIFNLSSHSTQQAVAGQIPGLTKSWIATADSRTRQGHLEAHRKYHDSPIPVKDPYVIRDIDRRGRVKGSAKLMYPGDPSAPPQFTINCLLPGNEVWAPGAEIATDAVYSGPALEILTSSGSRLSVTPNHPVLTSFGFVGAQFLHEGDEIISGADGEKMANAIDPDNEHAPAMIEQIAGSSGVISGERPGLHLSPMSNDFHGDARFFGGDVNVIALDGLLGSEVFDTVFFKHRDEEAFRRALILERLLSGSRPLDQFLQRALRASDSIVRRLGEFETLLFRHVLHTQMVGFAYATGGNSVFQHTRSESRAGNARLPGKGLFRFSGDISVNESINSRNIDPVLLSGRSVLFNKLVSIVDILAGFLQGANVDTGADEMPAHGGVGYRELASDALQRLSRLVQADKVIKIRRFQYTGHVYDLQTRYGYYIANSCLVKNCRCREATIHPSIGVIGSSLDGRIASQLAARAQEAEHVRESIETWKRERRGARSFWIGGFTQTHRGRAQRELR